MNKIEPRELVGKRFNGLTILSFSHTAEGKDMYNCKCHCGNSKVMWGISVKNGREFTCGCNIDFLKEGQQYNHLTLLKRNVSYRTDRWYVECVCGNSFNITGIQIRRGYVKSCGCKRNRSTGTSINELALINLKDMMKIIRLRCIAFTLKAYRMKANKDLADIPKYIASPSRYFDLESGSGMSEQEFKSLTTFFNVSMGTFMSDMLKFEEHIVARVRVIGMESELELPDLITTLFANMVSGLDNV